jgi:hypothetical protein
MVAGGGFDQQGAPLEMRDECERVTMTAVKAIIKLAAENPKYAETIWASFLCTGLNGCVQQVGMAGCDRVVQRSINALQRALMEKDQ